MDDEREDRLGLVLPDPEEPVAPELLDRAHVDVAVRVGQVRQVLQGRHVLHVPVAGEADEGAAVRGRRVGGRERVHPGRGGEGEVDGLDGGPARGEEGAAVVVGEGGVCRCISLDGCLFFIYSWNEPVH